MRQGELIHGFVVRSVKELPEQKAVLYQMEYVKNGAELIWLDNGEKNKLFSIAFKTLPSDDTGVFHILEHSVLGGSRKYPVKEPFLSMIKSSMNTFLNAMTFSDKTVYPVSSRNENDFMNLVSVYLDAVFCPTIYDSPLTFYQEGWHYELENADEQPIYKGVVYNEMKGVYSSVDALVNQGMNRMLFPDSCYRFEPGGDPERIPDLSYEEFIAAHREFYHPTNAKIYLDGSVPVERVLSLVDSYLSAYEKSDQQHDIHIQIPAGSAADVKYYAIGEEEDTTERVQMSFGKIICDYTDRKKILALAALSSYLIGSNESPLKQAVLRKGLAQDAFLVVGDGVLQPYCYLRICNTEYERKDEIKKTVIETGKQILEEGLDRDELDATINQIEFQMRELDEPKGLGRNLDVLSSWLYGGDPEMYLTNNELFRSLRESLQTDYFDELLREVLLDWTHMAELYLLPSVTKGAEDIEAERKRLAAHKEGWSFEQLQDILHMNRELTAWQTAPDEEDAVKALPSLSLDEIDDDPDMIATEYTTIQRASCFFHPANEADVVSFNLYFSLSDIPSGRWGALSFLTNILGLLPTKRHSAYELQREIKRNIGFLDYNIVAYAVPGHPECCKPYFAVNVSVLRSRMEEALRLLTEIVSETVYHGEESTDLIFEILLQSYESVRQGILENGHEFAMRRAASYVTAEGKFMEQAEGHAMYEWLEQFIKEFDGTVEDLQGYLQTVQETVFTSERMTISVTADEIPEAFTGFVKNLHKPDGKPASDCLTATIEKEPVQEIIKIPSGVSYAASVNHLSRYDMPYSGSLRVLSTILSYEYLWNEVRVRGGAYGCGCQVGAAGSIGFYSYRDPAPVSSVSVYRNAGEFVQMMCKNDEPIDNYIISSIAATEPLQSLREQGQSADADTFCGITVDRRRRIREEMLHTTKEDLLAFCDFLHVMSEENSLCIIGNAESIKESGDDWIEKSL